MKLNLAVPNNHKVKALYQPWQDSVGGAEIAEIAALADDLGFNKLTVGEHFAIPHDHVELSGAHYLDATTALAYLAGSTRRIRLASNVSILPLKDPIVQAKQWSVLDWLSLGRADLIVGVGWLREEFDLLGIDFRTRGRRMDEYIEAIKQIWSSDRASYQGEFVEFHDIAAAPKPVQPGGVPLWFAGDVPQTFARVARWGVGWSPRLTPPEKISEGVDRIMSHPDYHGQQIQVFYSLANLRLREGHEPKPSDRDYDTWNVQELIDQIGWAQSLGITEAAPPLPRLGSYQQYLDRLRWLAEEIMPRIG